MSKTQESKAAEDLFRERESRSKTKFVKCADEDDDRDFWAQDGETKLGLGGKIYLNPMFAKAELESRRGGWRPAFSLDKKTNEEVYLPGVKTLKEAKRTYGAIQVLMHPQRTGNLWILSVWGADDDFVLRRDLTEEKANWWFDKIKNHITKRTLNLWGFKYD